MRPFRRRQKAQEATPPPTPHPQGAEPEIPSLKKKEKERKGAGVPWYAGSGSGGAGLGGLAGGEAGISGGGLAAGAARVGASAASRGFLARMALALSNLFGGPTTMLGGLFASKLGSALVAAGMLLWGGLMSTAGLRVMNGGWGAASPEGGLVSLSGAGDSGIVIDGVKDGSLDMLSQANEGELVWGRKSPLDDKDAAGEDAEAVEEQPAQVEEYADSGEGGMPEDMADPGAAVKQLAGERFGKLSSNIGGGGGASSGRLANGLAGFNLKKNFQQVQGAKQPRKMQARGNLGRMNRINKRLSARKMSTLGAKSGRAMGQLKFAKGMSAIATQAGETGGKTYAADAFDQGVTQGGEASGIGGGGSGVVVPPGAGVSGGVDPGSIDGEVPEAPDPTDLENKTPYQSQLDSAKGLGQAAGMLKLISVVLIALGIALIAMASGPWAFIIIAIGVALIAMGAMMFMMAQNLAGMADNIGQGIADQYGQEDQGAIVDECTDQAIADGTAPDSCHPATTTDEDLEPNSVEEDAEAESSAGFTVQ